MAVSESYKEFVIELFQRLGPISIRSMFGGGGVYCDGVIFGLIVEEVLYLKADPSTVPDFEAEDMAPFSYDTKTGGRSVMSYWRMPERLFDEPDEAVGWARKALRVSAMTAKAKKRKPGKARRAD